MDGQIDILASSAIVIAMIAVAAVYLLPYRRARQYVMHRRIAAPREQVWDTYITDLDSPASAAFHDNIVSSRVINSDPEIVEFTVKSDEQTEGVPVQIETLVTRRPEYSAIRCVSIADQPYPFGEIDTEEIQLEDDSEGTVATLTWRGETRTLAEYRLKRAYGHQYMDLLKRFCETGEGTTSSISIQSPWKSLGLTTFAVASFIFLFGWVLALILTAAIVVHEYGHWLAMRMTGQPKPRIMLIPFFGGIAVPNHPYETQFDDAFVSLMGAGLSLIPCLALLGGAAMLDPAEITKSTKFAFGVDGLLLTTDGLLAIAMVVALLNGLQLLPLLPLDGGHVLRSLIQSASADRARPILLGLAGVGMIGFAMLEQYVLVAILALGALQAWHLDPAEETARPMGGVGIAAIGIAYCLLFGIYAGIMVFAVPTIAYLGMS